MRRGLVVGAIVILIIVIVVACVVSGCGKIVEGAWGCKPYKNVPGAGYGSTEYCACAVVHKLYKPESHPTGWGAQIEECMNVVAEACEGRQTCELPPDRRNS